MDFLTDNELLSKFKKYTKELYYSPNNKSFELTKAETKDYKLFIKLLIENLSIGSDAYKVVSKVDYNRKFKNLARFKPKPKVFDFTPVWNGLTSTEINSPKYLQSNPPTELTPEIIKYLKNEILFENPYQFNELTTEQKTFFINHFKELTIGGLNSEYQKGLDSNPEKTKELKGLTESNYQIFYKIWLNTYSLKDLFTFFQIFEPELNKELFGESFTNWYLDNDFKAIEPPKAEIQQKPKVISESPLNQSIETIKDILESSHKNGYNYFFTDEQNFNAFCFTLANLFEGKQPPEKITFKFNKRVKTILAKALKEVHFDCSPNEILSQDTNFLNFVSTLEPFKNPNKNNIYASLTK